MTLQDSCFLSLPLRCKGFRTGLTILSFVKILYIVSLAKITAATTDSMAAAANVGYKNGTNRRWFIGTAHLHNDRDDNTRSSSWKEIAEGCYHENSRDDLKVSFMKKNGVKKRLSLFHFGKINQLSRFEGNKSNNLNEKNDIKEEHPLRTNIWDLNLKWSLLSQKSKSLSRSNTKMNTKEKVKNIQLELDPEGYCRIYEIRPITDSEEQNRFDSSVLAIGRWKKRPWGVIIIVRPLVPLKSSLNATNLDDDGCNGERRYNNRETSNSKKYKDVNLIDEQSEFVFHANGFHWNGFGSNPKLTQGTILFQKQKKKSSSCWWKSTTMAYSSILPVWPEEILGDESGNKIVVDSSDRLGAVHTDLLRLSGISNILNRNRNNVSARSMWFRPVVGTFSAKGII